MSPSFTYEIKESKNWSQAQRLLGQLMHNGFSRYIHAGKRAYACGKMQGRDKDMRYMGSNV